MKDDRCWRVKIGIDVHWITEKEKDYFVDAISHGEQLVGLRGGQLFLSSNVQEIASTNQLEEDKKLSEGRYQCEFGNWHTRGIRCVCDIEVTYELDASTSYARKKVNKITREEYVNRRRNFLLDQADSLKKE